MSRLGAIWPKLERAEKHISDFYAALGDFIESFPYMIIPHDDPHSGDRSFHVMSVKTIPPEAAAILGDAIHNLRSALDYLVYQLVLANGNTPDKQTSFPIFDDPKVYKTQRLRKVKGMRKRL